MHGVVGRVLRLLGVVIQLVLAHEIEDSAGARGDEHGNTRHSERPREKVLVWAGHPGAVLALYAEYEISQQEQES